MRTRRITLDIPEKVLLEHLSPAKAVRFLASWQMGVGDYQHLRDAMFGDETVDTLYEKIVDYQDRTNLTEDTS